MNIDIRYGWYLLVPVNIKPPNDILHEVNRCSLRNHLNWPGCIWLVLVIFKSWISNLNSQTVLFAHHTLWRGFVHLPKQLKSFCISSFWQKRVQCWKSYNLGFYNYYESEDCWSSHLTTRCIIDKAKQIHKYKHTNTEIQNTFGAHLTSTCIIEEALRRFSIHGWIMLGKRRIFKRWINFYLILIFAG